MKRLLSVLLILALAFSLAACGLPPADQPPTSEPTTQTTAPAAPTDPTDPSDPIDPSVPQTPTDPTDPSEPTDPSVPQAPTDPSDPSVPAEPDTPVLPTPTVPPVTLPTEPEPEPTQPAPEPEPEPEPEPLLDPNGSYTSKEDVALYIHLYGKLPQNFITKSQARNLGWKSGSLERYAPGKCIGGDTFQNREGLLPKKSGRTYKECDIDTLGKSSRGAKRIVFSNDGLVYYTDNHYASFTLLYGEP